MEHDMWVFMKKIDGVQVANIYIPLLQFVPTAGSDYTVV